MYAVLDSEKVWARAVEQGLDRRELAEVAGVTMDTIRRIEREEQVTLYTTRKVAQALDVEPRSLWHPEHRPLGSVVLRRA